MQPGRRISRWSLRIAGVALALVALLPLSRAGSLDWLEYLRIWLAFAGLTWLWAQKPQAALAAPVAGSPAALGSATRAEMAVLGLALVFLLNQFAPVEGMPRRLELIWVTSGLILLALVAAGSSRALWRARSWLDWAALAIWLAAAAATAISARMSSLAFPWHDEGHLAALLLVWFAASRAAPLRLPAVTGHRGAMTLVVLVVLAIVSVVGVVRVGEVYWQSHQGQAARAHGDLAAAAEAFERARQESGRLAMADAGTQATWDLAGVLVQQGESDRAAAVLGLAPGFIRVVPAEAWEGLDGGNLYSYAAHCWKDVELLPGETEIRIFASGTKVEEVWALMQVKLDEQVLGELFVTGEVKPYSFTVAVPERSTRRLEIHFLNDFYQADPYIDRNLLIDRAEIEFRRIAWDQR